MSASRTSSSMIRILPLMRPSADKVRRPGAEGEGRRLRASYSGASLSLGFVDK